MVFRNSTKATTILFFISALACADKIGDINPFDDEPAIDETPAALANAYCERVFTCPYPFNGVPARSSGTVENCRRLVEPEFRDDHRARIQMTRAGRIAFNADVFDDCLEYIKDCDHPLSDLEVFCGEAYTGSVPLGGSCRDDFECIEATREVECAIPTGRSCGTCTERTTVNIGEPCDGLVRCREDQTLQVLFCGEGNTCVKREDVIVYDRGLGEPCSYTIRSEGAHFCHHGLLCEPDERGNGTCQELTSRGQPCSSDHECAAGLECADMIETCEPNVRATTAGADCDNDSGPWCANEANLACDQSICKPTNLPNGAACSRDLGRCSGVCIDGVCRALRKSGEACGSSDECEYPLSCPGSSRVCSMATGCE